MFGIIICNKNELTEERQARYQSVYCSLCKALKNRFGQIERMTLSYDMTFLAMLLNGLYEGEEKPRTVRCSVHPLKEKNVVENKYIDYAADMTVLLAYFKCIDDWEDERSFTKKLSGNFLKKDYERLEKQYPRQVACVRESVEKLAEIEKNPESVPDEAVNCSGRMLSEIFVYQEDFWSDTLRKFGYELGRFIYLMDAALDYEKDIKKKNYNPLLSMEKTPKELEPILVQAIGNAAYRFEQLPIVQDEEILKNIIYAGVWQQYYAKMNGKEQGEEHKDGK